MSTLNPSLASEILAAVQAKSAELTEAFAKALDGPLQLGAAETGPYAARQSEATLAAPGLLTLITADDSALAIVLPASSGLLPAWAEAPDPSGKSKFAALAEQLAKLVLPESVEVTSVRAAWAPSLVEALARGAPTADAASVAFEIMREKPTAHVTAVWPLTAPQGVFAAEGSDAGQADNASAQAAGGSASSPRSLDQLPGFSRSLLKVRLPVSVHLASKRECVQEIVEIVPGSIIKFDKGCDELLHMVVGGQAVAEGEAVKVGDKFGFRVTAMLLPREHFVKVKRAKAG